MSGKEAPLKGVGMVVVDLGALLVGLAVLPLIVAVVSDDGDGVAEMLLEMARERGLAGAGAAGDARDIEKQIKELTKLMKEAAQNLEFEQAVIYRDKIKALELLAMRTYDNSIFVNGG